jgi:hypothetical protein
MFIGAVLVGESFQRQETALMVARSATANSGADTTRFRGSNWRKNAEGGANESGLPFSLKETGFFHRRQAVGRHDKLEQIKG